MLGLLEKKVFLLLLLVVDLFELELVLEFFCFGDFSSVTFLEVFLDSRFFELVFENGFDTFELEF